MNSPRAMALSALFSLLALAGCYTEIGNPGKEQKITATFTIDYSSPAPVMKSASAARWDGLAAMPAPVDTPAELSIEQFFFRVVEANYGTETDRDARIWKFPDSLGFKVDFTGGDTSAVLPPVDVPAGEWTTMKLESRIPAHDTLIADTIDYERFQRGEYIKGTFAKGAISVRFICRLPAVQRINLVYSQELLAQWRHGDAYDLEFIFFANRWMQGIDLLSAESFHDTRGRKVVLVDLEHNRSLYDGLYANFFKSFNSWKVWKEIP
jgi:hypothetical protein